MRWRVILSNIALAIIAMGGLSLFLHSYLRNTIIDSMRNNLLAETRLLAEQSSQALQGEQPTQALTALVRQYARSFDQRVTIVSPDGRVIGESLRPPNQMENHLTRPEIQSALSGVEATTIRYSTTFQADMLYAAIPLRSNGEIIGVARMAVSLAEVENNLAIIRRTLLIAALLTILAAILLAILLGNFTVRPLQQLTHSVIQMKDGTTSEVGSPERLDEVGQLERAFGEMTSRLNSQIDELRSERGKLAAVLTYMTDGILIADKKANLQLINPSAREIFHISKSREVINHSLIEVIRHHQLVKLLQKCQESNTPQSALFETTPDRLFIQAIATPLTVSMPGHTLLVFQDLTRIRRLETVRRDFISNVSHELRTPLASLKAITDTLMEGALEDPPAAKRFLLRMNQEIDNLTQMVRELLELSRIESGKVPLETRPIAPLDLVSPAVERMRLQAERAGLSLRMDISPHLPQVMADPERLEQVLVNLLHNAIKFTPPGGEIVVGAYGEGQRNVFFVRDSGVGISPDAISRIFERFYKADRARSGGGTGLGLSICRHLVESHQGHIWAESMPAQGSTFYFSIPTTILPTNENL